MSEKKAKQQRQEQAQQPKIVGKMEIVVYENSNIAITNPPNNLTTALILMAKVQTGLVNYFSQLSNQGSRLILPEIRINGPGVVK